MSEKRPNVFGENTKPIITNPLSIEPNTNVSVDSEYESKKLDVANEVYTNAATGDLSDSIAAMHKRTEEQIRLRDEMLLKNKSQTENYQEKFNTAKNRIEPEPYKPQSKVLASEPKSPLLNMSTSIQDLSQPQFNTAFDVIPLPSEGKLYKSKKPNVKVAYMTTADENILSSPNLLQSGEFLEILINRKLLETDIRYRDLHVGDRNAIMLWLRATSYGEMYPVTIFDENSEPFETEIDLTKLNVKKLGAEPDAEGYFDLFLPLSNANIKFKLLTVGDVEDLEKMVDEDTKNEMLVNNLNSYKLEKHIVEVNGDRNISTIKSFVENMRVKDSKVLKAYIESVESGIELEIEVRTPRGGSVKTFLPLSVKFFWPEY